MTSVFKSRIKNILDYKKPKFWITFISLIVVIGLAVGLISNPIGINSSKAKAEKFLKTYYTIENTDIADIFYASLPDLLSSQYNLEALGGIEGSKWQETIEAKYGELMTEEALDKALANRIIPEGEMIAKEFGSKAKVSHINLLDEEIVDSENISYNYRVFILVNFRDGKEEEGINVKGSIEMSKNDGLWKVSKFRPNNGELEEALTVGESYLHINNSSNAIIRIIEVQTDGSSSGAMNADNSDMEQGARFSFDMIDTNSLNFKVRLLDSEKNILLQQDFTEDFSEGKDFHIYIKDGEDGKLRLEGFN